MSNQDGEGRKVAKGFGARLRGVRTQTGTSRDDLARDAGLDLAVLDEIEAGTKEASVSMLIQTATALGVPVNLLLDGIKWRIEEGRFEILAPPKQFVAGK